MEPQHMMKFKKTTQNSNNYKASPGGIQPTAKQLKPKPRNWVNTDVPPGSTFMPTRRFLGKKPKISRKLHNYAHIQFNSYNHCSLSMSQGK